jgi:transcriptional regulator with XRE-family HTH domain
MKRIEWHTGDVIGKFRMTRGWTRARLARQIGMSAIWMGRIERTGLCPGTTLERIADALGITAADIRAHVPLGTEQVVCRAHREILAALDRVIHENEGLGRCLEIVIDSCGHAVDHGYEEPASVDLRKPQGFSGGRIKKDDDLLLAQVPGLGYAIPSEDVRRLTGLSRQGIHMAVSRGALHGIARAGILWISLADLRQYMRKKLGRPGRKTS